MARKRKPADDVQSAVDDAFSDLLREAARESSDEEREALEAWLNTQPDTYLSPAEVKRLLDVWNEPNAPYQEQRAAGVRLAAFDIALLFPSGPLPARVWKDGPKPGGAMKPPPSKRQHGHRFTDDEIYDAVARALADGMKGLGRTPEAHRPASGYELWRAGQADGASLPGGRQIRNGFLGKNPRPGWKLRKGEDVWTAVVRLGRKAGRIPK